MHKHVAICKGHVSYELRTIVRIYVNAYDSSIRRRRESNGSSYDPHKVLYAAFVIGVGTKWIDEECDDDAWTPAP